MCGRYVSPDDALIERESNLVQTEWQVPPRLNVAPTHQVSVIRAIEVEAQRTRIHSGSIPFAFKGEPPKYSNINSRIETVETATG